MRGGFGRRLMSQPQADYRLRDLDKGAIRLVFWSLKGESRFLIVALLLSLVLAGASVATPLLVMKALDDHIASDDWNGLILVVAVYVILSLLQWLSTYWQTYLTRSVAYRAINRLRNRIFTHLMNQDYAFHTNSKVGVLSSTIMNDTEAIYELISQGFVYVVSDILILFSIAIALVRLNARLALTVLTVMPIILISTRLLGRILRKAHRTARHNLAVLTAGVEQNIAGVKAVKTFSQEERQTAKLNDLSNQTRKANVKAVRVFALLFPIMDITSVVGLAMVLWQGGILLTNNVITLGILSASISYVRKIFMPLRDLSQIYSTYQNAGAALDRIHRYLSSEPRITYPSVETPDTIHGHVMASDVTFSYKDNSPAILSQLSLEVRPGERIGIIGTSGVGKSTLIKLLARLYDCTEGTISIDSINLRQLTKQQLRQTVQVVSQSTYLFPVSIWENIAYGLTHATQEHVVKVVEQLGLSSFFNRLERGLETMVGEGGKTLSGGQRQAVAIARAMIRDPKLIIFDEAASNLDSQVEQQLHDNIHTLWQDKAVIVVTHRTTSLRLVDKVYQLMEGKLQLINKEEVLLAGFERSG